MQSDNVFLIPKWIEEYQKPVVDDECRYEGNLEFGWGDNSAQGMMDNFWRVILRGGGCPTVVSFMAKVKRRLISYMIYCMITALIG